MTRDTLSEDNFMPACRACDTNRNGLFTSRANGRCLEEYRCERCGAMFDTPPRHIGGGKTLAEVSDD